MTDTDAHRTIPLPESTIAAMREARARFDDRLADDTAGPADTRDLFSVVADITAWLDASNPAGAHEDAMRVLKLTEEAGEAAAAYIGMVGQNPRKGVTHTLDDLLGELADVALTALCAIQHFTQSETATRALLDFRAAHVASRAARRP